MSDVFNPYQDRQFCGAENLRFFTDLAPRRVMLDSFAHAMLNQGSEQACTGYATDVVLDVFCGYRNAPVDLSWSFIYWIARKFELGSFGTMQDSGVVNVADIFKALYLTGACTQVLMPDDGQNPTPEAFADAATRKVTLFERMDYWDYKNAVITALAHGIPVAVDMAVTFDFSGISSTDPVEQMAAYNLPTGRIGPGFPNFLGYHFLPIIGYDLDLDCVFVHNSWGEQWANKGICAISFATLVAQTVAAYVVREFAGLTSYVDPKYIVAANARHDSAAMLAIRRFMVTVLTNTTMSQVTMSQITRAAMPLYGVNEQDLLDSVASWGVTMPMVDAFLTLSAP